jgi:predicted ATPase
MKIITKIEIRKFRSIKSLVTNFSPSDLNIFVGQNDQGKSNILRALNLFFNNETDVGQKFRFADDYCYHANKGKGTVEEVRVDLFIQPPKNRFKNPVIVKWSKQWKKDGSIVELMLNSETNKELPFKNNIRKWLEKLRYRYVPAIKGSEYFTSLMGELHDVLNSAHELTLKQQGQGFIKGIQKITQDITDELNQQIGIPNTIQVPSDFRLLFSNLDFGSTRAGNTYHLKQRGDGVKVRHIPVILKYMSEQERNISVPGFVKPDTIWGFEEPENNLELKYAFELAESFKAYSKDIQIFLTTHSPAFYALDKTDTNKVKTFFVDQDSSKCTNLKTVSTSDTDDIHEQMGLLPLITPHLKKVVEQQAEIDTQKRVIDSLQDKVKCLILSEDNDTNVLSRVLEASGFNMGETELSSYHGAGNLNAIKVIAKHYLLKKPTLKIIIHRDRDYLTDEKVDEIKKELEAIKCNCYIPNGVDVENEFLNPQHINKLYPSFSVDEISNIIFECTAAAEKDSKDKLINKTFTDKKPEKNAYAQAIDQINKDYDSNTQRYRYGKKVLGLVTAKMQHKAKINIDLLRPTEFLRDLVLYQLASHLWA